MIGRRQRIRILALCAALTLVTLLAACGSQPAQAPAATRASTPSADGNASPLQGLPKNQDGYRDITVSQLAASLPGKNYTLVNVHIPYEGELPQTDLLIPYDQIAAQTDKLPDKSAPVVLYCRSGNMSTTAARELVKLGYTDVMELDGGMIAWESAGQQLLHRQ